MATPCLFTTRARPGLEMLMISSSSEEKKKQLTDAFLDSTNPAYEQYSKLEIFYAIFFHLFKEIFPLGHVITPSRTLIAIRNPRPGVS